MEVGEYTLVNEDKYNRAVLGTVGRAGVPQGGVGEDAEDNVKLAEYDRLGGLVRLNGDPVKRGSFYDFAKKAPRSTPEVKLIFSINGKTIEVPAGDPLPPIVQAAKLAEQGQSATVDFKKMNAKQLLAYAEENGIDVGTATKKPDLLKVISEATSDEEDEVDAG